MVELMGLAIPEGGQEQEKRNRMKRTAGIPPPLLLTS